MYKNKQYRIKDFFNDRHQLLASIGNLRRFSGIQASFGFLENTNFPSQILHLDLKNSIYKIYIIFTKHGNFEH